MTTSIDPPTPTPPVTAPLLSANQPIPPTPPTPPTSSTPKTPTKIKGSILPYIIIGVAVCGLLYILLSDGANDSKS